MENDVGSQYGYPRKCSRAADGGMDGCVPRTDAALTLWTATDSLWRRYLNEFSHQVCIWVHGVGGLGGGMWWVSPAGKYSN